MATDSELLAADEEARAAALDVERSFIVQAPAGSGKTELLIQRYLTLLGTVDEPEEVIAITFTRKASAEMRLRVVDALRRAMRGDVPDQPHLKITAEAANRVLERDRRRDWQLVRNPRRLRIQTLDALNGSVARMQPLTAAASGSARVADENEMNSLYNDAATATLDWLAERGATAAATREVLLHIDNSTQIYVDYLSRMLRTRDQWLPFISRGELSDEESARLRRMFEGSLEIIVKRRLEQLRRLMPDFVTDELPDLAAHAVDNLRAAGKGDNPACALGAAPRIPGAEPDDLPAWLGVAELLLTGQGGVRKTVTKTQGFPPKDEGQKAGMLGLLERLADRESFAIALHETRELPPVRYSDEQWSVLLALFRLLPVAVAEFRRLSLSRGVTDHTEIAISAGVALGTADNPGDIAMLLDYQVRHILVDEMQDTSKAQYRMLEALTGGWQAGDGRTLFCVGDPMQSIYRFRNAEVAQFLLARENGIGSVRLEPLVLRRNFRSGENLVHWFNDVFPRVLAGRDDPFLGAVSYSAAVPVESLAGEGECRVHPVFGSNVDSEARRGAAIVREILDRDADGSVAVLVRSRTQLPDLLARFRDSGIAYEAVDIDRLTDLPEIIDCLALVRAAAHPGDRIAWLGLLRSPWVGLDWNDLHALVRDQDHEPVPALLHRGDVIDRLSPYAQAAIANVRPTFDTLLSADRSTPLQQRVEQAWFELGGPALLADRNSVDNVYHFFDTVAKLEVGGTIKDIARLMDLLDAERVSMHSSARVQVLTMHKAKGLQFDHVVLYGLGRHPAANRKQLLTWFDIPDPHGEEEKVISPVGRRDTLDNDPLHQFIGKVESRKDHHEQARLLYVACTRARRSLHLVGHVRETAADDVCGKADARSLLNLLWPAVESDYQAAFETAEKPAPADESSTWLRPELRRFDRAWQTPAPPDPPGAPSAAALPDAGSRVEYYWVGADARIAGTIVHRWLERAASGRLRLDAATLDSIRSATARWARELGAGSEALESIAGRVAGALEGVRNDERGDWILNGPGESELALTGIVDGRPQNVVLDRVRIDDDGVHWIIDYKTSTHMGGDLDGFIAAEIERYTPQMTRYAQIYAAYAGEPVRCALYFPLLCRFAEIETAVQS